MSGLERHGAFADALARQTHVDEDCTCEVELCHVGAGEDLLGQLLVLLALTTRANKKPTDLTLWVDCLY